KADSPATAIALYKSMLGLEAVNTPNAFVPDAFVPDAFDWAKLAAALGCVWFLPNSYEIFARYRPALGSVTRPNRRRIEWRPRLVWAMASAACLAMTMMPARPVLSFLYFQF